MSRCATASAAALLLGVLACLPASRAEDAQSPELVDAGRKVYRSKCIICHGRQGGRGPNLFKTELSDEAFMATVLHGRQGTQMPAFRSQLSEEDVTAVRAFVHSTDHFQ
jgi:mono/diheme cytochrome c family protein